MKHKHYEVILAWANGAEIQCRIGSESVWVDSNSPRFFDDYEYRVKPKTIMIGDVEVPEPLKEAPSYDQTYWTICFDNLGLVERYTWIEDSIDRRLLDRGLVHLDPESATLHAKALIKVSGGQV